jgi:hypothetical protein
MAIYDEVRRYESPDGLRAVAFYRGDHGRVRYARLDWREPDPEGPATRGYWLPMQQSPLYDTLEAALDGAAGEIDWLMDMRRDESPPDQAGT